jgi:hypothetical protein
MDTMEVTQGQYEVFRAAGVPITEQPHVLCNVDRNASFDTELIPSPISDQPPICEASDYDPAGTPGAPVVCVNFCDAVGYCAWAGKRLCGVLGRPGETFGIFHDDASELNRLRHDPEHDLWYNACSGGGEREYPYGAELDPDRCSFSREPDLECAVVGTEPPVLGVLGGAMEYLDFCSDDAGCFQPGEDIATAKANCSKLEATSTATVDRYTGFRCCYEFEE